jgi:hypothetical protein
VQWLSHGPTDKAAGRAWVAHRYFALAFDRGDVAILFEALACEAHQEHSSRLASTIQLATQDPLFDAVWQPLSQWLAWSMATTRRQPLLLDDPPADKWELKIEAEADPWPLTDEELRPDPAAAVLVNKIRNLVPLVSPSGAEGGGVTIFAVSGVGGSWVPKAEGAGGMNEDDPPLAAHQVLEPPNHHPVGEHVADENPVEEVDEGDDDHQEEGEGTEEFYWDPDSEWFENWTRRVCLGQWSKWCFKIGYFSASPVGQQLRASPIVHARMMPRAVKTVDCKCGHSHKFLDTPSCGCRTCHDKINHVTRRLPWFSVVEGLLRKDMAVCSGNWCKRILESEPPPPSRCPDPGCHSEVRILPVWYRPWANAGQRQNQPAAVVDALKLPEAKADALALKADLDRWKIQVRGFINAELDTIRAAHDQSESRARMAVLLAELPFPRLCDCLPLHWEVEFVDALRMPEASIEGAIERAGVRAIALGGGAMQVPNMMFRTRKTYVGIGKLEKKTGRRLGGWVQWAGNNNVPPEPPARP